MTTRKLLPVALLLALSTCALTACGGGGGNGMIRADAASDPPPPPSPATAEAGPCPSPVTSDCTVDATYTLTWNEGTQMTGGRQSDHALTVKGTGWLNLKGDNRFSGGTTIIEDATLVVWDSLTSDVHVTAPGTQGEGSPILWLGGTLNGNVLNDNIVSLAHLCGTGVNACVEDHHPVINGDFQQSHAATLDVVLGWELQISGKAAVDGKLGLLRGTSQSYVLPAAPASILVLHANGGVSGQFAGWSSPSLFLAGNLRYLANDIYFDATSISAVQAMSAAPASKVDPLTLGSAAHFDAALGHAAAGWARMPHDALSGTQRRFLASVGAIQRIQDYAQATRTLDSLSAHGYADAADAVLQQAVLPAPELMAHAGNLHAGSASGSWFARSAAQASRAGTFSGQRSGFDVRLGERLLLGSSFGWNDGSLRFERSGGAAHDQSPQWDVYARHDVDGNTYVFGDVGYSRHQLALNRRIDLGIGRYAAGARQNSDLMRAYVEAGRDFRVGRTRLTPFAAASYALLHGAGFTEQGGTGFELIAQPATYQRFNGVAGLRLGTAWQGHGGHWTSLNLTTGYRWLVSSRDDARVAFAGAPGVTFALAGMPHPRNAGWLQMNLATGNEHWNWLLSYDRQASDEALSLGAKFNF